ncbi:unnamed protein product, partial [Vitis vinifera]
MWRESAIKLLGFLIWMMITFRLQFGEVGNLIRGCLVADMKKGLFLIRDNLLSTINSTLCN